MRDRNKAAGMALALALFDICAINQAHAGPLQNENLIMSAPQGLKSSNPGNHGALGDQQGEIIAEYIPQAETISNWSQMMTVQVFHSLKKTDPDTFAESLKGPWLKGCDDSEVHEIKNGEENGYLYSLWAFACPMNGSAGKPKNIFMS